MNNCRAGIYSFASTTTWLHEIGIASPPSLVILGLTLPDSRILTGIASVGLTLANIAIMLPHLRQPILDSLCSLECALPHEPSAREQIYMSPEKPDAKAANPLAESPILVASVSRGGKHQSLPLAHSVAIESLCSADTKLPWRVEIASAAAPQTIQLLPACKTDDSQMPPQVSPSLPSEILVNPAHLLSRECRGALYIPLSLPNAREATLFDTEDATLSDNDPEEVAVLGDQSAIENYETTEEGQFVAADLPSTREWVEKDGGLADVVMAALPPANVAAQARRSPSDRDIISDPLHDLPDCGVADQGAQPTRLVGEKEVRRPECLEFIPQSVIRRYPLAQMVSARRCPRHQAFNDLPASPLVPVNGPTVPLEGTGSRATFPGHWGASFVTLARKTMGGRTFATETTPVQDLVSQPLPESPPEQERTRLRRSPRRQRQLGVLARAALRDRRSAARRREDDEDDESSMSDDGPDSDSDSQYSSGSSTYESMVPHILGADLIAAIDANSDSELNPAGYKGKMRTPLNTYEDHLISEGSLTDISMIMQVSSGDDSSDGEVGVPANFRPLTYEEIQRWATGVVQKCVRQVCRNHVHAGPSSPSQASEVCAERPSGSGGSQCPLAGLHCKLGAAILPEGTAPKTKELPALLPPTSALPSRKLLQVRNWRDIPEFVPRQRRVSMATGRIEVPRKLSMRTSMDTTRDAAARAIARVESQATFNVRQWVMGTEEKRMVNTAGGRQGTLRCA